MRFQLLLRLGPMALLWASAACGGDEDGAADQPVFAVDWADTRQAISGFGVSSAWTAQDIPDELADELFSTDTGAGLSLLRVRIAPEGETWETQTALKAQARGARVWAAPWSPPGEWKDNGEPENGGVLLPEFYGDWAERLASFVAEIENQGVSLFGLSVQNEPDYTAEWETCRFTPETLRTFIGQHLAPALSARNLAPRLIAPEAAGWNSIARFGDALLADSLTRDSLSIIATHGYNGSPYPYDAPAEHGKELWLTEVSEDYSGGNDPGMGSALWVARMMYDDLTIAGVNAWHYWWLYNAGPNGGLVDQGLLTRRGYVMGNLSRFVRPGSRRIETSGKLSSGVFGLAFRSADETGIVIVAVNAKSSPISQRFELRGVTAGELTPWVTSDDRALEPQAPIAAGSAFSYELPARSVTSFVGAVGGG